MAYSGRTTPTNYTGAARERASGTRLEIRAISSAGEGRMLPVEFPGKGSRMLDGGKLDGKPGDAFSACEKFSNGYIFARSSNVKLFFATIRQTITFHVNTIYRFILCNFFNEVTKSSIHNANNE